jgi:hypothetical protein
VSGGATGSGACRGVAAYSQDNAVVAFAVTPLNGSTSPNFSFSAKFGSDPSAFQAGTYTTANVVEATGGYFVVSGTNAQAWLYEDTDGGVDGGFSLTITTTGTEVMVDGGAAWPAPHGSVTVTLEPSTNATGIVTGTATF